MKIYCMTVCEFVTPCKYFENRHNAWCWHQKFAVLECHCNENMLNAAIENTSILT